MTGKVNINTEQFRGNDFLQYVVSQMNGTEVRTVHVKENTHRFILQRKGLFSYASNLPFGLYPLQLDKADLQNTLKAAVKLSCSQIVVNAGPVNGFDSKEAGQMAEEYGFELVVNKCHLVKTRAEIQEVTERFNSTRKKHVRRYQKAGELNVFSTKDPRYFEEYYSLYEDSSKRWGTETAYGKGFIEGLYKVPGIVMWVAEKDGKMLSAMICIYSDGKVFDWLAASIINEEVKKLYAAAAVQYEVIRDAADRRLEHVNMGASKDLGGVIEFKESWGAEELETYTFIKRSGIFAVLKKIQVLVRK